MILNSAKRELLEAELLSAEGLAPKGRSLTGDAMRRLMRNKAAALSLIVLAALVLIAIFGSSFLPFNYEDPDWNSFRGAPDFAAGHYFGTDQNGREQHRANHRSELLTQGGKVDREHGKSPSVILASPCLAGRQEYCRGRAKLRKARIPGRSDDEFPISARNIPRAERIFPSIGEIFPTLSKSTASHWREPPTDLC